MSSINDISSNAALEACLDYAGILEEIRGHFAEIADHDLQAEMKKAGLKIVGKKGAELKGAALVPSLRAQLDKLDEAGIERVADALGIAKLAIVERVEVEAEQTQELPVLESEPAKPSDQELAAIAEKEAAEKARIHAKREAVLAAEQARREGEKAAEQPVAEPVDERPLYGSVKIGNVTVTITATKLETVSANGRRVDIYPLVWTHVLPETPWSLDGLQTVTVEALNSLYDSHQNWTTRDYAARQFFGKHGLKALLEANLGKLPPAARNTAQQKIAAVHALIEEAGILDDGRWDRARVHMLALLESSKTVGADPKVLERIAAAWGITGFESKKGKKPQEAPATQKVEAVQPLATPTPAPQKAEPKSEEMAAAISEFLGMEAEARKTLLRETLRFCVADAGDSQKAAVYEAGKVLVTVLDDQDKRGDAAKALIRAISSYSDGHKLVKEAAEDPMGFLAAMKGVVTAKAAASTTTTASAVIPPEEGKKGDTVENIPASESTVEAPAVAPGAPCHRCNAAPVAVGSEILCDNCVAEVTNKTEEPAVEAATEAKAEEPKAEGAAPATEPKAEELKQGLWSRAKSWIYGMADDVVDAVSPEGQEEAKKYAAMLQEATQGDEYALVSPNGKGQMVQDLRNLYTHAAKAASEAKKAFFSVSIAGEKVNLLDPDVAGKHPQVAARVTAQWAEAQGRFVTTYVTGEVLSGFTPAGLTRVHMLFEYFLGRKLAGNRFGMFSTGGKEFSPVFEEALKSKGALLNSEEKAKFDDFVKLLKSKGDDGVGALIKRQRRYELQADCRAIEAIFAAIDAIEPSTKNDHIGLLTKAAGEVVFRDDAGEHHLPGFGGNSNLGVILTSALYEAFGSWQLNREEKIFIFALKTPKKLETQVRLPGFRGWGHKTMWALCFGGYVAGLLVLGVVEWVSSPIQAAVRALMAGGYLLASRLSKAQKQEYRKKASENILAAGENLAFVYQYPVTLAILGYGVAAALFGRVKKLFTRKEKAAEVKAEAKAEPKGEGIVARVKAFFTVEGLSTLPMGEEKGKVWAEQTVAQKALTVVAAPVRVVANIGKKVVEAAKANPIVTGVAVAATVAVAVGGVVVGAAVAAVGLVGGMIFRKFFGGAAEVPAAA